MTAPDLLPAQAELADLAAATRPDLDRDDVEGALMALHAAGWSWARVLVQTVLMLAHGEEPRDLRNAIRPAPQAHGALFTREDTDHGA